MGPFIFFGVSAVALLVLHWGDVKQLLPSFGKSVDSRGVAIADLDNVIAWFEAQGCAEGAKAARAVGPHFWHTADDPA